MLIAWTIIGLTLVLLWMIGCIMPVLPWPQLAYIGLLVFHFMAGRPFSTAFLLIWLGIMILLVIIDQFLPALATKKFWGSKTGAWGAGIGTFVGIFWGIYGIIFWPFLGALLGEWRNKRDWQKSLKPAFGSFIGIAMSGIIKVAICIILGAKLLMMAISLG